MTNLCYIPKKFQQDSLNLIATAIKIINVYEEQGFTLTVRQLYYQFVARDILPNTIKSYKNLSSLISDARLAGLISWTAIEDRTRNLKGRTFWDNPAEVMKSARENYLTDRWADQDWRPEVWIEKDALIGVIGGICHDLCIDYFACRGYNSQSEQWRAGQRFASYIQKGQRPIVFHLGDHDPSGIDMTRDNRDRLSMFAGVPVTVVRLALNHNQVEEHNPPPNPTKLSDPRAEDYISKFGHTCWELDALDPRMIASLINDAVVRIRDPKKWDEAIKREAQEKNLIDIAIETLK